jgi:hypothetical protein
MRLCGYQSNAEARLARKTTAALTGTVSRLPRARAGHSRDQEPDTTGMMYVPGCVAAS